MKANEGQKMLSEPKVATLAIVYHDDRLLLVKRKKQPQRFGWGFPGGSVLPGESLNDGVLRELKEETQLAATIETTLPVVEVNEFDSDGVHHHFILVPLLCRYLSGIPVAGDDALECRWMSFTDIYNQSETLIDHVATVARQAEALIKTQSN
ncbi:NUDIX domain-containing protein [Xenorhabdus sp. Reich]|uniref:NUDIX domain-containing protein n=2 Tax=Xenorhabdus littoralis TaxID=2582835 RepID=A0ABU4SKW1_9GAMM|nr:NUDIX domain-containing protein [Xenorhabdus sp. Reich]